MKRGGVGSAVALAVSLLISAALAEGVVRVYFASRVGPRLLLYGTPWHHREQQFAPLEGSVQAHRNNVGAYEMFAIGRPGAYSKYFPHESKRTDSPDRRESYPVRINKHGFRGNDFEIEKAPGTIRVLTLGASSTFGYHDRDDETYPFYLQQILERDGGGRRFEVINFAIPHALSDNILAMFLAEGLPLHPDVVTFYEGANDSAVVVEPATGWRAALWTWARAHFLAAKLIAHMQPADPERAQYDWSAELREARRRAFLGNLSALREACAEHGVDLIVATQQLRSQLVPEDALRGFTYGQEVALAREKLARGEIGPGRPSNSASSGAGEPAVVARMQTIFDPARVLLVHADVMAGLRDWAAQNEVGFVDQIAVLDARRDLMINWVHLRPEANRMIAEAFARVILERLARPSDRM